MSPSKSDGERRWRIHGTGTISDEEWNRGEIIDRGQPYVSSGPQLNPFEVVEVIEAKVTDEMVDRAWRGFDEAIMTSDSHTALEAAFNV